MASQHNGEHGKLLFALLYRFCYKNKAFIQKSHHKGHRVVPTSYCIIYHKVATLPRHFSNATKKAHHRS